MQGLLGALGQRVVLLVLHRTLGEKVVLLVLLVFSGALSDGCQTVSYDVDEKGERPRTLKQVISEVSVDSDGFPSLLKNSRR